MKNVIIRTYSNFHDILTDTAFEPMKVGASFIGHAVVSDDVAETLAVRPAFEVLTDEAFAALASSATPDDVIDFSTGDVLTDQAQAAAAKKATKKPATDSSPPANAPSQNDASQGNASQSGPATVPDPATTPPPPPPPS